MTLNLRIPTPTIDRIKVGLFKLPWEKIIVLVATIFACLATTWSFFHGRIMAYGDAESHINIAKRVVSGLTPGMAQLGGIWLPLPHLLMLPMVIFDPLWRSGLAGSIVSGISYIVTALFIYKLIFLLTGKKVSGVVGSFIFIANLNILYMQSTPLTELPLIVFMLLSTYYFCMYLFKESLYALIMAAIFGLCASLSRYDGWFLVLMEAFILTVRSIPFGDFGRHLRQRGFTLFSFLTEKGEGVLLLFSTIALIGIVGWLMWGWIILGNPLYFTNSQYSAKSQQVGFLARGELPAYHNIPMAFLYYFVTSMSVVGILIFSLFLIGLVTLIRDKENRNRGLIVLLLLSPFIFNVATLFMGQSVIYLPHLTPISYEWRLFNVRYGLLMIPAIAVLVGYLFSHVKMFGKMLIATLIILNMGLYGIGYSRVIVLDDGVIGLSHSSHPDAEVWMHAHYDKGLVLIDDYGRTMSIIGSGIPMQKIVYVGSHAYWDEALIAPERQMQWIVMQENDAVWKSLYADADAQGRLYKYFNKAYTSPTILIFERNNL